MKTMMSMRVRRRGVEKFMWENPFPMSGMLCSEGWTAGSRVSKWDGRV